MRRDALTRGLRWLIDALFVPVLLDGAVFVPFQLDDELFVPLQLDAGDDELFVSFQPDDELLVGVFVTSRASLSFNLHRASLSAFLISCKA